MYGSAYASPGLGSIFSKIVGAAQIGTGAVLTVVSGGAAAGTTVPMMAAGAGNIVRNDGKKSSSGGEGQATVQPQGNWLTTMPKQYLVIGGISVAALLAALSGRK